MAKTAPIYVLDAFTGKKFAGNQAAVCLINEKLSDKLYQSIGAEFNLSETAFPLPLNTDDFRTASRFNLRWFTPTSEVPLCGHATLATAHVLLNEIGNINASITFETLRSGELVVSKSKEYGDTFLTMNFPQYQLVPLFSERWADNLHVERFSKPGEAPDFLDHLVQIVACGKQVVAVAYPSNDQSLNVLIALEDLTRAEFEALTVPVEKMMEIHSSGSYVKGIILTVRATAENGFADASGKPYDFASRYFAPWYGIKEDPATGSAHCVLGPFWERVLGKRQLYACQCYPNRGAEFHVRVMDNERIDLTGQAVTIIKGEIHL